MRYDRYQSFLEDPAVHRENTVFWKCYISGFLQKNQLSERQWLNNPFQDDHIYHFLVPEVNRAVQIVQEGVETGNLYLNPFIDSLPLDEYERVNGLIIVLDLSEEVLPAVEQLLEAWLVEKRSEAGMDELIAQVRVVEPVR